MSRKSMFGLLIMALVTGLTVLPAAAVDTTFHDGFAGDTLDAAKWTILAGAEPDQIDSGQVDGALKVLRLTEASGTDGKIKSNVTFTEGSFCLAKVKLADVDGQRFGLDPQGEITGMGAYFLGNDDNTVRAVVTNSPQTLIFSKPVEITADEYHVYKIFWEKDTGFVKFYIDGELVATYDGAADLAFYLLGSFIPFTDTAKPLVLWSAHVGDTKFDWVFVTPIEVNLTYADFATYTAGVLSGGILYDLDSFDVVRYFTVDVPIFPAPLADTAVTSFNQQSGVLVGNSIHTSSIADQSMGVFFLNEGREITWDDFSYFFTPKNPKFGAGVDYSWGVAVTIYPSDSVFNLLYLFDIEPKYNKKGGGLLNVHTDWSFTDTVPVTLRVDAIIRTPDFPQNGP